ncbi:unnamed protein product [Lymnaea stagnalis]|uniref:Calcitonin receptor n=1 Tax=Lymnaea stagnalis TaxID=6523 RepID=A0AAV2HZU5_LYMST
MATLVSQEPNMTSYNISYLPSYGINWQEEIRCRDVTKMPPPDDGHLYCPAVFDSWLCWDYTLAGTVAEQQCPHSFKPGFSPDEVARKTCNNDGTWYIHPKSNQTWTNYGECANVDGDQIILYMSISGYAISCVLLVISLGIFSAFRQLKCSRVVLHQHLFVSFILTGVMWILTYALFLIKPEARKDNPVWCKVIHVITQYATLSNYFWMFCEGFFLHTIVVQAFSKQRRLLIACSIIGWVLPLFPVIAYVIVRALDTENDVMCWFHQTKSIYILSSFIVLSLLVNFLLLLNILRILLSKIRAFNTTEHNQNRRAVKATLILVPLLGLQNLFTLVKPPMDKKGMFAWDMASAILVAYQGAAVALIFCFFNGEVLTVLKRRFGQWSHSYDPAFLGRPSANSTTMAMTLDDTSTTGAVFKNGNNRMTKASARNAKESTELQLMVPGHKGDKGSTFNS